MSAEKNSRLRDLETVLRWEGRLDNARVRQICGVQPVWASRLLAELIDALGKRVQRATSHAPLVWAGGGRADAQSSPDDYLRVMLSSPSPPEWLEDARMELGAASRAVYAEVVQAVQQQVGLRVTYRSMNSPDGRERVIFPHSLVRVPRRWHVRAWCAENGEFRDFTLGRMTAATLLQDTSTYPAKADQEWRRKESLTLVPHPALSPAQQQLIALENFGGKPSRELTARACLMEYVLQDLRVAVDPDTQGPPQFQLALAAPERYASRAWAVRASPP
jgi:hypothetical protein